MPDDEQLRHFSAIVLWLLDLHAPLRRYIKNDDVNPWFTFGIERAMFERNFAYHVRKSRRRDQDRNRNIEQRKWVNYMAREAKRSTLNSFIQMLLMPCNPTESPLLSENIETTLCSIFHDHQRFLPLSSLSHLDSFYYF
jgi:hypothetical protein